MKTITVLIVCLALMAGLSLAMPPREGIQEPAPVIEARKQGMDSPKDGLIQQIKAKGGEAKISGSRNYPVVMGYFTNLASTFTQANFQNLLFNTGAGVKSVNNYYRDMSYNAMSCSGKVDVWRSSGNTVAYFGNGANGLTNGTTKNVYEFIKNVLTAADASVDFSAGYDQNDDGNVDVLWVIHAGKGAEETGLANDIWSHSFNLTGFTGGTVFTTGDPWPGHSGKYMKIDKYIIMPEKTDYSGAGTNKIIGCGVFCHEFGHALGLPDLYDTGGYSITGEGLGNWSAMAGGSWGGDGITNATPASLDVWCKRFLGWIAPFNIIQNGKFSFNNTINTAANGAARIAKLGSASASQYWLIEDRSKTAAGPVSNVAWDANLPGAGLAIYHIDDSYTSSAHISANDVNVNSTNGSSRNRPYGVAMEETDQTVAAYTSEMWTGTNRGEAVDIWTSATQANLDSMNTAYPVTYLNDGASRSGTAVRKIPAAGKGGDCSKAMACTLYVIPAGPLGVNLSQFTASSSQYGITLNWRTESEMGSYVWAVERSAGTSDDYQTIKSLPAYGTTNTAHDYSYTDDSPELVSGVYYYRLIQTDASNEINSFGPAEVNYVKPGPAVLEYFLMPCHPNPSKGAVSISYSLKQAGQASLKVYNLLGLEVNTLAGGWKEAGAHTAVWDGKDRLGKTSANGIYFYKLVSGNFTATQKITILR